MYNLTAVAKSAGVSPRNLRNGIKRFLETGEANEALQQVNVFLENLDDNLPFDELAMPQMQSYLADLRRMGWSNGRILSVALLQFWHSKEIVRCPKCECAVCYPPEIPILEGVMEVECSFCGKEFEVEL